jgi:hypothetical protein
VPVAPAASRVEKTRELVTTDTPVHPAFPHAMVLTVSFALSPVTGLVCHRRQRSDLRQLDASVGASGPHDFAVRFSAVRQRHRHVHRIPPRVRDDRETPLQRDGTAVDVKVIWVRREQEYFCERGWTRQSLNSLDGQISGWGVPLNTVFVAPPNSFLVSSRGCR